METCAETIQFDKLCTLYRSKIGDDVTGRVGPRQARVTANLSRVESLFKELKLILGVCFFFTRPDATLISTATWSAPVWFLKASGGEEGEDRAESRSTAALVPAGATARPARERGAVLMPILSTPGQLPQGRGIVPCGRSDASTQLTVSPPSSPALSPHDPFVPVQSEQAMQLVPGLVVLL